MIGRAFPTMAARSGGRTALPGLRALGGRIPLAGMRALGARFAAGETADDAARVAERLAADGLLVTVEYAGDAADRGRAGAVVEEYLHLLGRLADSGLGRRAEVTVRASALGPAEGGGEDLAGEAADRLCAAAHAAGTAVTIDPDDDPPAVAWALRLVGGLRRRHPDTGVAIPAALRAARRYSADLAASGVRVVLRPGGYARPVTADGGPATFATRHEADRSYVRCLTVLMAGPGHPVVATPDPRLIEIAATLAIRHDRPPESFEYQLDHGVRPDLARRLAESGARVRVRVPYGRGHPAVLRRRLAERPADLGILVRSSLVRK